MLQKQSCNHSSYSFNSKHRCIFHLPWAFERKWRWGNEYLSSLLRFVLAPGISKLLLYTDLLQWDRRESEHSVSLFQGLLAVQPARLPPGCDILHTSAKNTLHQRPALWLFKQSIPFHLCAYLCPCCVMSIALLAGTGEPPSVTLRTSIDFLSGLLLPWRFNMGESTRFLGGSAQQARRIEYYEWTSYDWCHQYHLLGDFVLTISHSMQRYYCKRLVYHCRHTFRHNSPIALLSDDGSGRNPHTGSLYGLMLLWLCAYVRCIAFHDLLSDANQSELTLKKTLKIRKEKKKIACSY